MEKFTRSFESFLELFLIDSKVWRFEYKGNWNMSKIIHRLHLNFCIELPGGMIKNET